MPFSRAAAQSGPDASAFIASRQAELAQVGRLIYRVRFDDGSWTHQQVSICPAFTHFAFVRYTRTPSTGEDTTFLAVFALDNPPAQSLAKPWQGGILLVPEQAPRNPHSTPLVEKSETIKAFNHIWSAEMNMSGQRGVFPTLTWPGLADCYARFAGEEPSHIQANAPMATSIDVRAAMVDKAIIPLQGSGLKHISLAVQFDRYALLTAADLSTSVY